MPRSAVDEIGHERAELTLLTRTSPMRVHANSAGAGRAPGVRRTPLILAR